MYVYPNVIMGRKMIDPSTVDDMADRCDRLEQEMLMRDVSNVDTRSKSTLKSGDSTGGEGAGDGDV